ncbi:MAG: tetratricopeptide repeat protein [candidate division Zixibacteria bacterium]|jgi:tetratricopeptide (TPR) repeat protein|nr:tetratricopeptide repeat protein [candidate division Zixibacteria bacterium]
MKDSELITKAERLYLQDEFGASFKASEKALKEAQRTKDFPRQVECLILQTKALMSTGEATKAKRLATKFVKMALDRCPQETYANALIESGYLFLQYLEYAKAEEQTAEALVIARDHGLAALEADALVQLASIDSLRQNHNQALVYLRQALHISDDADNSRSRLETMLQQGQVYGAMGNYEKALDLLEHVQSASMEQLELFVESLLCQGDIYRSVGDFDKAERMYDAALSASEKHDVSTKSADILKRVGNLLLHKRDFKRALEWFRFAEKETKRFKSQSLFPFVPLGYGTAYNGLGDYKQAIHHLKRAIEFIAPDFLLHSTILSQTLDQFSHAFGSLNKTGPSGQAAELSRRIRDLSKSGVDDSPHSGLLAQTLKRDLRDFITSLKKSAVTVFSRHGVRIDLISGEIYGEETLSIGQLSDLQLAIFNLLVEREGHFVSNTDIIKLYEEFAESLEGVPRRAHYFIAEIRKKLPVKHIIVTKRGRGYTIPSL